LGRLPAEWDRVKIKELGELYAGSTPRRSEPSYWEGDIPWLTPSQVTGRSDKRVHKTEEYITQEGYESTSVHIVPPGSLLVTTRATIGEVAIAGVPMTTNQGFKNVVLKSGNDSLFYYYLLRFITDEMRRLSSGSTFDEISKSDFGEIIVPRPSPEQQRRIAEVLDTVDAAIQQTDAVIAKQQQVKTGLLQDLLTRGLDEQGCLRDPERHPEQFKDSPLGRIPKVWEVKAFGSVIQSGPQNGLYKPKSAYRDDEGGHRIVRIDGFYDGILQSQQSFRRLNLSSKELSKYGLSEGDILTNRVNSLSLARAQSFRLSTSQQYSSPTSCGWW
jgi:type I restriction enzyme S subunit